MPEADYPDIYKTQLAAIEAVQEEILQCCGYIIKPNSPFYITDLFVLGALKRAMSLCAGFVEMIKQRNYTCAAPMLRMQVDTAARLYALQYVGKQGEFAEKLIHGERFDRLKDKDGRLLKDFYVIRKLAEIEPWVTRVYEKTSNFVHLSGSHFFATISDTNKADDGSMRINLVLGPGDPDLATELYEENLAAFVHASKTVKRVAMMYLRQRESSTRPRPE